MTSSPAERKRRSLIVSSYCFPPDTSVGAMRWDRLSRIFAEDGWRLEVVTCAPSGKPLASVTRPDGVTVHYVPQPRIWRAELESLAFRLLSALKRVTLVRSGHSAITPHMAQNVESHATRPAITTVPPRPRGWQLATPRSWMRMHWTLVEFARAEAWGKRAARIVARLAKVNRPDFVVSSAPPHPAHIAVARTARRLGIPFVMDMRDPWSLAEALPEHFDTPLWYELANRAEEYCVARSALVVANTPPARNSLAALHSRAASRIISVFNGSDDDPLPPARWRKKFVIAYAGTVYTDRDPRHLLRAVAELVRERNTTPEFLSVRFMGDFGPASSCDLTSLAAEEGIANYVEVRSRQPRPEALSFQMEAAVLVTFPGFNAVSVPAKVFECIRFPAWVLALSPAGSATEELLAGTDARVIVPERIDLIAHCLSEWMDRFQAGERPAPAGSDDRFSRRRQAEVLMEALAALRGSHGTGT